MTKCNLIYNQFDTPYYATNYLKKCGFDCTFLNDEADYIFILNSNYEWNTTAAYLVGKASGEGKKICLLCRNDNDCYAEDWIIDAAHVAVNMETCEEIEMCEL